MDWLAWKCHGWMGAPEWVHCGQCTHYYAIVTTACGGGVLKQPEPEHDGAQHYQQMEIQCLILWNRNSFEAPGQYLTSRKVYNFKTTYDQMDHDLLRKDRELYVQNGILHVLDRSKKIKPWPERFQKCRDLFDLILTCEESV